MVFQILCNTRVTHVREKEEKEEEEEHGSLSEGGWIYREKRGKWSLGAAIWLQSRRNQESSARREEKVNNKVHP